MQVTQDKAVRADMYRQYLKPVLNRPNLHVQHSARATTVAFESARAVGVNYDQSGTS